MAPLRREQFRATTNGTALELLQSEEALGDAQLNSLKKIIAGFDPLYGGLSDDQKKIADAILREGAQNAMIGGIPFVLPRAAHPSSLQAISEHPRSRPKRDRCDNRKRP